MLDTVIANGTVVTSQGAGAWEIGIKGEQIVALGLPGSLPREGARVVDAAGSIVVPGAIDPHTHLAHDIMSHPDQPSATLGPEDDTRGMAYGGTTTHIDFVYVRPGVDNIQAAIEQRAARWKSNSHVDYAYHITLSGALDLKIFEHIPEAMRVAVYFVHTEAKEGVDTIREARGNGQPVYGETLHQYACFNAEYYKTPRGFCSHTYPSLKFPEDQEALWRGLVQDGLATLATDEYPTPLELKLRGRTIEDVDRKSVV